MSNLTYASIKRFLAKQLILSILSILYFGAAFWVPLSDINGFEYINRLIHGAIQFNNIPAFCHPIFLLISLLMVVYNLRAPILILFSKNRCEIEANPSECLCSKLNGSVSCSALLATIVGTVISFLTINSNDMSGFFIIGYCVGGLFYSILLLTVASKDSISKYFEELR